MLPSSPKTIRFRCRYGSVKAARFFSTLRPWPEGVIRRGFDYLLVAPDGVILPLHDGDWTVTSDRGATFPMTHSAFSAAFTPDIRPEPDH